MCQLVGQVGPLAEISIVLFSRHSFLKQNSWEANNVYGKIGLDISKNNCLDLMAPDSNNRVKNSHGILWSSCQINDILIKHRALKIFLLKRLFWFNIFYLGSLSIKEFISYNLTPLSLYGHIKQRITLVKSQTSKGQLISKCSFGVFVWTKIPSKKFDNFCPRIWRVVKS